MNFHTAINVIKPKKHYFCEVTMNAMKNNLTPNFKPPTFLTDYYPFGYPIAERSWTGDGYRFGFNGQEKDDEIYGEGASLSFEFRNYDSRIGRFWNVDPISSKFPYNSPYAFCENTPIAFWELEGLEKVHFVGTGKVVDISNKTDKDVKRIFNSEGFRYDSDWYDGNASGEYWSVANAKDYWGNSKGTYIYKYASESSYNSSSPTPYYKGADRNFIQWLAAKDETFDGTNGYKEGLKLMGATAGMLLTGGGLAIGSVTPFAITLFAINTGVSLDDISKIGNEDTFMEEAARSLGGADAVKGLQVSKVVIGVFNSTKSTYDIGIHLRDGEVVKATYDALNKVWTQVNIGVSATNVNNDNGGEKRKE